MGGAIASCEFVVQPFLIFEKVKKTCMNLFSSFLVRKDFFFLNQRMESPCKTTKKGSYGPLGIHLNTFIRASRICYFMLSMLPFRAS